MVNVTGFYTEDELKTVMQCSVVVYHAIFQLSLVLVYTFAFRIGGKPRKYQGLVENFMIFMRKLCITSENMLSLNWQGFNTK